MQVSKIRVTTVASSIAMTAAVLAFAIAPVNAVSSPSFMYSHHNSDNFKASSYMWTHVENENKVDVDTTTTQNAMTGNATVMHNDDVDGSAGTGAAMNHSSTGAGVSIANNSQPTEPSAPSLDLSQVDNLDNWDNVTLKSSVKTSVENENKVYIDNITTQTAVSGSASVTCNDDVTGDVTTGDASNTSSVSTTVSISN